MARSKKSAPVVETPVQATPVKPNGKKTECPVTKEQFLAVARALKLQVGDQGMFASVKEFSTGSFGWYCNDKFTVTIGDKEVRVQPSISLVVVGSKDAK